MLLRARAGAVQPVLGRTDTVSRQAGTTATGGNNVSGGYDGSQASQYSVSTVGDNGRVAFLSKATDLEHFHILSCAFDV